MTKRSVREHVLLVWVIVVGLVQLFWRELGLYELC